MKLSGNVFITGGAGFLGRGILKRAHDEKWDAWFTVFSRDETKHARLLVDYPKVRCVRGSVSGDLDYLTTAMQGHDIVIHAAATKVIPVAERNVLETIQDNIIGSSNVAYAACKAGIKKCLGISTDKASHPANLYGATKMCMERIFQEAQRWDYPTEFHLVRYGNVLDSTASVLTLWKNMIERDGYITSTSPDMTRFFLTIDQAVDLVLLSLTCDPSAVLVPELPAAHMGNVAKSIYPDVKIDYRGLRPGEKEHETLVTYDELNYTIYSESERCFLIYPSIMGNVETKCREMPYTSNAPVRWISPDDFAEMLS